MNLLGLDFLIFKAICDRLDLDSSWRKLIEITSNTRFQLNAIETEKCARCLHSGGSPSTSLLKKFDSIGMSVETLIFYLDKLKFEDCLRYLKEPEPLEIIKQPTSEISISEGKRLEIHCEATGFPYPEYVWFRGKDRVSSDKQGTLLIRHARSTDSGTYTCRVQNFHETRKWTWVMSRSCKVQVQPSNSARCPFGEIRGFEFVRSKTFQLPQIILQPTNKSSECGGPVVFKVKAQHPVDPLKYQWFYNDRPIPNANRNELRIEDVTKKNAGRYQVRVYSQVNENIQTMSKVAKLEVNPEPNQYTAGDKVALVIGNAFYRSYGQVLPAVEFDLYHTKEIFEKMGFKVVALLDQTLEEMKRAVDFFCHLVTEDAYVIFYCMGHGFLYEHKHFLVPWDLRQGNDVRESLCIESCMTQIQNKCPKMLMVLVDLCRQMTEHSQVEEIYPTKPSKSLPNYVIIYATILGEQSFEEGSNVCNPRGLFNKYLLDVLDNPDVKVNEIYGQLQYKFQRCPYNKEKYPQHPQMDITLEEPERSLWDPVASCYNGSDEITKKEQDASRNRDLWQFAHVIPGNVHIPLDNKGLVVLSFSKYLSNVLLMKPIITNFNHLSYSIQVELHKERVDQVIQPVLEVQTDPPEYKFCNLQRLKDKLTICLTISIITPDKPPFRLETELIDLGRPLAASLPW